MDDNEYEYDGIEGRDGALLGRQMGLLGDRLMAVRETIEMQGFDTDSEGFYDPRFNQQSLIGLDYSNLDSIGDDIRFFGEELQSFNNYQQARESLTASAIDDPYSDTQIDQQEDDENFFTPLIAVLNRHKFENDSREVVKRRSLELHFGNIMGALADKEKDSSGQLLVTLRRWYNDFAWNLSRATIGLMAGAVKTIFSTAHSILFGKSGILGIIGLGKDRKSETQRLIDAVEQQTEYFMTGKIDQTKGLVAQLRQHGLIGASVRGVGNIAMNSLGLGRELHQANEVDRAKGVDNSDRGFWSRMNDRFSKFVYSDSTVKYGNHDRSDPLGDKAKEKSSQQSDAPVGNAPQNRAPLYFQSELPFLKEVATNTTNIDENVRKNGTLMLSQMVMTGTNLTGVLETQLNTFNGMYETVRQERDETVVNRKMIHRDNESVTAAVKTAETNTEWREKLRLIIEEERHEGTTEQTLLQREQLELISKNTKDTALETRKHRRQAFFRRMLSGIGRLIVGIASIAASAISMLGGILGITKFLTRGKAIAATTTAATVAKGGGIGSKLLGKLKYAIGGIVAVGAVLSKKGAIKGLQGLVSVGKVAFETVKQKGFKGAAKSATDSIKEIDKTKLKSAAIAMGGAAIIAAKKTKDVVFGTLKQRKADLLKTQAETASASAKAAASASAKESVKGAAAGKTAERETRRKARSAQMERDSSSPIKEKGRKTGGVKTLGKLGGALAISGIAAVTDEKTKVGGAARTAETAATGHFIGGLLGAIVGGIAGGIGGVVAGGGFASVPMALAGIGAGGAKGWAIGSKLGLAGGAIKGAYDNKDALTGKALEDAKAKEKTDGLITKDIRDASGQEDINAPAPITSPTEQQSPLIDKSDRGVVSPHHTPLNTDIDGSSKIKNAGGKNALWAKPTMDEPSEIKTTLTAIQESISMPLDYIKNTYDDLTKVAGETVDKLTEGNEISKAMAKTMKEMADKMSSGGGSPFSSMGDPTIGAF